MTEAYKEGTYPKVEHRSLKQRQINRAKHKRAEEIVSRSDQSSLLVDMSPNGITEWLNGQLARVESEGNPHLLSAMLRNPALVQADIFLRQRARHGEE